MDLVKEQEKLKTELSKVVSAEDELSKAQQALDKLLGDHPDIKNAMEEVEELEQGVSNAKKAWKGVKSSSVNELESWARQQQKVNGDVKDTVFGIRRSIEPCYKDNIETIKGLAENGQYHLLQVNPAMAKRHVEAFSYQDGLMSLILSPVYDVAPGIGVSDLVKVTISEPQLKNRDGE
jgi:hypothetical protein